MQYQTVNAVSHSEYAFKQSNILMFCDAKISVPSTQCPMSRVCDPESFNPWTGSKSMFPARTGDVRLSVKGR